MHPMWHEQQFRVIKCSAGKVIDREVVSNSAWFIVLGNKNSLPRALLTPNYYQHNNMIVLSKHANQCFAHTLMENRAPVPSKILHQELGLCFIDFEFELGGRQIRKCQ